MTTVEKAARRVYSTEELHRLRGCSSAPKLHEWIERHDGEDADLVKALLALNDLLHPATPSAHSRPLSHCLLASRTLSEMAKYERQPDFEFHRRWVEQIIQDPPTTPELPQPRDELLLTEWIQTSEHVLRGSKSFAARSFRSRAPLSSLRFPSNISHDENIAVSADPPKETLPTIVTSHQPVLGDIPSNAHLSRGGLWRLRPSPTPSIRKKKIEALVQNHGSPTHVRVTAGGRIVPSEQSPLCHPRFGYSAIKTNGGLVKVAPNHIGKAQWTSATQDGAICQDTDGKLCQIINGTFMPLTEEDGALRLYMPAPNLNITGASNLPGFSENPVNGCFGMSNAGRNFGVPAPSSSNPQQPSVAAQKNALELEYSKLEVELKELDRAEVLHGRTMGKTARDALFGKRRELVTSMDRVRKALKSATELLQDAVIPTSPKAMRPRGTTSPQNRLPPFLQRYRQNHSISAPPSHIPGQSFGHPFFGPIPPQQPDRPFGYPTLAVPDAIMAAPQFQMPPPNMFMQPPPFDGPVGVPMQPYQEAMSQSVSSVASPPAKSDASAVLDGDKIPQNDGSNSCADLKAIESRPSKALPIKDPETKKITNSRFILNPMSPEYKPGAGFRQNTIEGKSTTAKALAQRAPTPLLFHNSKAPANKDPTNDVSASPVKRTIAEGSSISSIKTADFFPRNTREYSMRKHEYPVPSDEGEDKENVNPEHSGHTTLTDPDSPLTPKRDSHNSDWNPEICNAAFVKFISPKAGSYAAPTVPPGTPVNPSVEEHARQPLLNIEGAKWEGGTAAPDATQLPDRSEHNISPKNRRQTWRFVEEHPSCYASEDTSPPAQYHDAQQQVAPETIDFTKKSREWIEGYQAGLHRKPVAADRMRDFIDGYCSGLLKSQPITAVSTGLSDGSPTKPIARRPSPGRAPVQSAVAPTLELPEEKTTAKRPPFENSLQSFDTLKQAVIAPQNENALLTPAPDGPHVNDAALNLGAWQKRHRTVLAQGDTGSTSYPFPQAKSLAERQENQCGQGTAQPNRDSSQGSRAPLLPKAAPIDKSNKAPCKPPTPAPGQQNQNRVASAQPVPANRISSITSIDSTIYRPWPTPTTGPRMLSPSEWKSTSSVGHAASLATGFMAQAQYDGTSDTPTEESAGMLTHAAGFAGSDMSRRGAFREGSLDGGSPSPVPSPISPSLSPMTSPRLSPVKAKKEKGSPGKESGKSSSPAKAKFEHIASRVGIKVSAEKRDASEAGQGAAPVSTSASPGKKRWRDIWRSGGDGA